MNRCLLVATLAVALLAGVPARAGDDDPPDDVAQVFSSLRSSWQSGSADGVAQYFGEMVGLFLDAQANSTFKRKQAPGVLRAYFERTQVEKLEHKKYKKQGAGWSQTLKYEYRGAGDREAVKGTLILQIRNADGRWILDSAHVGG